MAKASAVRKNEPTFCAERTLSKTTVTPVFACAANSSSEGRLSSALVIFLIVVNLCCKSKKNQNILTTFEVDLGDLALEMMNNEC